MEETTSTSAKYKLTLLELTVLLYHMHRGAQLEDKVGFEDCEHTLQSLTKLLSPKRTVVPKAALESALWSCNLMDEIGEWWSPDGRTFDQFLSDLQRYRQPDERVEFDKVYNRLRSRPLSHGEMVSQENLQAAGQDPNLRNRR